MDCKCVEVLSFEEKMLILEKILQDEKLIVQEKKERVFLSFEDDFKPSDSRPVAKAIGCTAILIICALLAFLPLMDLAGLFIHIGYLRGSRNIIN